jgi:hypothetical protein
MKHARTSDWVRTRRYDEPSKDLVRSSLRQSCPDCIIATHGYSFREGQVSSRSRRSPSTGDRAARSHRRCGDRMRRRRHAERDAQGLHSALVPRTPPMYPMHRNEDYANDLDNPDPHRDLHRTRDQRLPAGRVLITTHSVETARRPQSRRASIFGAPARRVLAADLAERNAETCRNH